MGSEGGGGGFFHLFDWNKRSRKKLFSNGNASNEETSQGNKSDDNMPTSGFYQSDQDELERVASAKAGDHYSSASTADEEGSAYKTPGVIARLMGLDYIPTSGISEPYSTPLHDSRSIQDDSRQKRHTEMYTNDGSYHVNTRSDVYSRKSELKSQKMLSSPIERFQIETLPPRFARTITFTHHKLLSPVKNPGFISSKNATYIIEAAAKILESELHSGSMGGVQSLKSSLNPSKVHDSNGIIAIPKKISMFPGGIAEQGAPGSHGGQTSKRSSKELKDSTVGRFSVPSTNEAHPSGTKSKGKPVSSATQAKVNAQRREGSSTKGGKTKMLKDKEGCSLNKPLKSLSNDKKNNQHKRASTTNDSGVLRQNNQRQNYTSGKSKLALPSPVSEQQGMKIVPRDASSEKNNIVNKLPGNAKVGYMKKASETADPDKDRLPSIYKNFTRKKRLVEQSSTLRCGSSDNIPPVRHGKQVQHNVVMDEHSRRHDDNTQNCSDVVSFAFTSPIRKPTSGSQTSRHAVKNQDKKNGYSNNPCEAAVDSDSEVLSHLKLNVIEGDSLGILLERKLQELTSGAQSPYRELVKGGSGLAYASVLDDSASAFDMPSVAAAEHKTEFLFTSIDDELSGSFDSDLLASGQSECMSYMLQEVDRVQYQNSKVDQERGHRDQSPLSCHSIESWESTHGSKMGSPSSSIQAQDMVHWMYIDKTWSMEPELELSDTASSSIHGARVAEISIRGHTNWCQQDMEYVKEILTNTGFMFENLIPRPCDHSFEILDPVLFDQLEETRTFTASEGEGKNLRTRRKIIFDSVNECLDSKCSQYFRAGYCSWVKGVAVVAEELAEELYKEISGWKSIGDWMVDELVSKDMSTYLGSWISFEIEAFETRGEIEREVLSSLLGEVVADFL